MPPVRLRIGSGGHTTRRAFARRVVLPTLQEALFYLVIRRGEIGEHRSPHEPSGRANARPTAICGVTAVPHIATLMAGYACYFILSYAAAKSASGSGTVSVSLFKFWNEIFNCLPDFIAANSSGAIVVPA
jgi:hypothetical protein